MSKLSDALNELGVFNTWGLLQKFGVKGRDVAVSYSPGGVGARVSGSRVWSPSFKTNPGSPWYDRDQKTFAGLRVKSFPLALAWATERYGIEEWKPSPMSRGERVPAYVVTRAMAACQQAKP